MQFIIYQKEHEMSQTDISDKIKPTERAGEFNGDFNAPVKVISSSTGEI